LYEKIVGENWDNIVFVSRENNSQNIPSFYWISRPVKIGGEGLVCWYGYKFEKLYQNINNFDFPLKLSFYGFELENNLTKLGSLNHSECNSYVISKIDWHYAEIPVKFEYGSISFVDRLTTQAVQLNKMIKLLLQQQYVDELSFLQYHLPKIIEILNPLYFKIVNNGSICIEKGTFRNISESKISSTYSLYEYPITNQTQDVLIQLGYPLTEPVKTFIEFCILQYIDLISAKNIKNEDIKYIKKIEKITNQLNISESENIKISDLNCRLQFRMKQVLDQLSMLIIEAESNKTIDYKIKENIEKIIKHHHFLILIDTSYYIYKDKINLLNGISDYLIRSYASLKNINLNTASLPKNEHFEINTNIELFEHALDIIFFKIFPYSKLSDEIIVSHELQSIKIASNKNNQLDLSVLEKFDIEFLYVKKLFKNSKIEFKINEEAIVLSKAPI